MQAAFAFPLTTEEALRRGVAQWLVPLERLMAPAMAVADHIAALPPLAARAMKGVALFRHERSADGRYFGLSHSFRDA